MTIAFTKDVEVIVSPRDPFNPPPDLEAACSATRAALALGLPGQPNCHYPTTVNGPMSYDRNTAIQLMNAVTQWTEHLGPQIGIRRSAVQALKAGVDWMEGYVKFAYKGKTDKLSPEQFERLQMDRFQMDCLQAEILLLDTKMAALGKAFQNASRNLTGVIAT